MIPAALEEEVGAGADVNQGTSSPCASGGASSTLLRDIGGIAGLFDYGPLGCTMKTNVMNQWRRIYALEEGFLEIDGETIGPEAVFKASGHVDNFADLLVSCAKCEERYVVAEALQRIVLALDAGNE